MDALGFLARLQADRHYRGQIAAVRTREPRDARYQAPREALPERLRDLLRGLGIEQLYAHQAQAIDAIAGGRDVIISTGTASGKSLCYHVPVLARLLDDPDTRALYMFPAKALAQDQLGSLERMIEDGAFGDVAKPACYDGDTPSHKRAGIRRSANILLTNPDMLHQGILPYSGKWEQAGFFRNLKYVVLDEIHTYRGIFGSHVAGVLRRLLRLCRHYGSDPQFICCSATLGNPRELAERLVGRGEFELIDEDASPRGRQVFVLWNPPFHDEATRVSRRSGNVEAQHLMQRLMEEGAGTITFTKARVVAELIYKYVVESLRKHRPDLVRRLRPYRGGYLPLERREIEQKLFSGELLGVCSTTALELGIDVGALDAALLVGFPGTLCSLWQQAGRAGRRQDESLAIFIAYDDPVDQYLMRHPDFVIDRPLEQAIIDPQNPHVLWSQLQCAACEYRLTTEDVALFGEMAEGVIDTLVEEQKLGEADGTYHVQAAELPHHETSLRTISNATFSIVDITGGRDEVIGQVDSISAPELVYPEAVYIHQGESYIVRKLDWEARLARVERLEADYYTQPVLADECRLVAERMQADCAGGTRYYGDVRVQWETVAFQKFKLYTQESLGQTDLDLPPQCINTTGMWLQPPEGARAAVLDAGFKVYEALSGVRNLLMVALPPLAMCDRYDIGGVVNSSQLGVATIILYDRYEGGMGYARHGYAFCADLLRMAREIVRGCTCEDGCPGCVAPPNLRIPIHHDPDVGRGYAIPNKTATRTLLEAWGV
jgi:DEAD/DEAH box helicase domain-containing protein